MKTKIFFNCALSCVMVAAMLLGTCSCKLFFKGSDDISGKAGEVLVVCPTSVWESEIGTLLLDSLMQECPCLPQREPLYTLVHVPSDNFSQMFKIHRNIIYLNVDENITECKFNIQYDRWSRPQIVIFVSGHDMLAVYDLLQENMPRISRALEVMERVRVIANAKAYQEPSLADEVNKLLGARMVFPSTYSLKKKSDNFLWISYETAHTQQGFFIYRTPAGHTSYEMSGEGLVNRRNRVMKMMVPGSTQGSYMTTSSFLEPQTRHLEWQGREFEELRGLWEVQNDFMGGPFASHNFYSQDGDWLITLEAYVYAPKYDKRLYMRQVESLLYTFEW